MSEMVERVAKAIFSSIAHGATNPNDVARAAISAMRELTPELIEAAIKTWDHYAAEHRLLPDDVEDIWEAVIDKVLE